MAIQTAIWPLQEAVFQRLSEDTALMQLATGVHDLVEEDLVFPYITIGAPTTLNIETRTSYSEEISITIHSWSVYGGKKESYNLLNAVAQAIGKGLSIEGPFKLVDVAYPTLQVIDDVDPRIKHGLARFKFIIQNN